MPSFQQGIIFVAPLKNVAATDITTILAYRFNLRSIIAVKVWGIYLGTCLHDIYKFRIGKRIHYIAMRKTITIYIKK